MQGIDATANRRMTRRRLLVLSVQVAGAGLIAGLMSACGQQTPAPASKPAEPAKPAAPAATTAPAAAATTAPAAAKPAEAAKPTEAAKPAAPASKPAGGSGGTLKVGHFSNPSQLDPHKAVAGFDQHVSNAMFDPLVGTDRGLRITPATGLAESWDSPDLINWTFKLKKGVKFHDGTDFNAAAVKFNVDRMKDPATKSPLGGQVAIVDRVEVVDDYTVKMVTKSPYANIPALFAGRSGFVNSPAAVQKAGNDYGVTACVGTGPFKFVSWTQNDKIIVEKNTSYWDPARPKVDRVEMSIIPDDNVRLANVKTGQQDATHSVAFKDIQPLRSDKSVQLVEAPGIQAWNLVLHGQNEPFKSLPLRQSLAYTIDREAILQAAGFGSGTVANAVFTPGLADFYQATKDVKPLPRDLDMAKKKLAEAGKPNGFEFEYVAINIGPFQTIAQIVQAQAAEVGIKANINVMDDASWSVRNNTTCDAPSGQTVTINRLDLDSSLANFLDPDASACKGGRFNVPEVTELVRKARGIKDLAAKQQIYAQIAKLQIENVMDIQLVYPATSVVLSPKVGGFQVWGDGFMRWDEVTIQS